MGWLNIKQTFNSNRMKKELIKQTKLMEQQRPPVVYQPGVVDQYAIGYFVGWADCNREWERHGHSAGGCQ